MAWNNPITRITFGQWGDLGKCIDDESNLYTPTLDEFCIGFTYYSKYAKNSNYCPEILGFDEKCGFTLGLNGHQGGLWEIKLQTIARDITEGFLKVKILDKDDFLELGFVPNHVDYLVKPYYMKVEDGVEYSIEYGADGKYKITIIEGVGCREKESVVFFGRIRNKFELSKILNQVKWEW